MAILLDTSGPEIRTGFVKDGGKVSLVAGDELKLATDCSFKSDATCIALSYDKLCSSVKEGASALRARLPLPDVTCIALSYDELCSSALKGNIILCADGSLSLRVRFVGAYQSHHGDHELLLPG